MTEQIVIKLNKEKFKPVFEYFNEKLKGNISSDSWFSGFCIWYMYRFMTKKEEHLDNKTRIDYLLDNKNQNFDEAVFQVIGEFTEFFKKGKLPDQENPKPL